LLLIGEPGTAKSWLSEHLAAAINGDSTKVVQGTAGTTEEQVRYTGPDPKRCLKITISHFSQSSQFVLPKKRTPFTLMVV